MATSELGRRYAKDSSTTSDDDHEEFRIAPGRRARTANLMAPAHPVVSGILARKADGSAPSGDPEHAVAAASASSGSTLPTAILRKFEASLGADLSAVRIHTGEASATAASAIGARAYTFGQDIHFASGQYDPTSAAGEHLLAHEVAHTVQQRGGSPVRQHKLAISSPTDALEVEADRMADAMVAGAAASVSRAHAGAIQRDAIRGASAPAKPSGTAPKPAKPGGAKPAPKPTPTPTPKPSAPKKQQPSGVKAPTQPARAPSGGPASGFQKPAATGTPHGSTTDGKTPASGIDWKAFWSFIDGDGGNLIRTGLEITRLVPGLGLVTGFGADAIELEQNLASLDAVKNTEAGENMKTVLWIREGLVALNNIVGHLRYVGTLVQDGVIASVVGSPLTALTGPTLEAMNAIGLALSSGQLVMDLSIAVGAKLQAGECEGNKEAFDAWHGLQNSFIVNSATDVLGVLLDIVDAATGSLANASVIKEAKLFIGSATRAAKGMRFSLVPFLKNWAGIWGASVWKSVEEGVGKANPLVHRQADPSAAPAAQAPAANAVGAQVGPHGMLRSVAGKIMLAEIDQIETAYRVGDVVVQQALGLPAHVAADVANAIKQITGAKDPFIWLRDKLASGIQHGTAQVARMLEMKSGAAQAEKAARTTTAALDTALAALEKLHVPTLTPAATNLGDNAVAKTAGSLVDGAKGLGAGAANAALGKLQAAVDEVREPAKQKAASMKTDMTWVIKFVTELQNTLNEQTAKIGELGALFAQKLSKCQNVEDIFNMLFGMGAQIMGSSEFTVDDLRSTWQEIRATIDEGFATARAVAAGTGADKPAANAPAKAAPPAAANAATPAPPTAPAAAPVPLTAPAPAPASSAPPATK